MSQRKRNIVKYASLTFFYSIWLLVRLFGEVPQRVTLLNRCSLQKKRNENQAEKFTKWTGTNKMKTKSTLDVVNNFTLLENNLVP